MNKQNLNFASNRHKVLANYIISHFVFLRGSCLLHRPERRANTKTAPPYPHSTHFWTSTTGSSSLSTRTNQRSILHQQQQQALSQGRFFRRKSSFAAQSSRRSNPQRQSGDNLFGHMSKRPNLRRTLSQGDFSMLLTRKQFMVSMFRAIVVC